MGLDWARLVLTRVPSKPDSLTPHSSLLIHTHLTMFFSRFFAVAVAALASVSFVSAAPTAEKDILVKRSTDELVYNSLSTLNVAIGAKVDLISSSPLSSRTWSDVY